MQDSKFIYVDTEEITRIEGWWRWLNDKNHADRAILRRAANPEGVLLTEAFFSFLSWMDNWQVTDTENNNDASVTTEEKTTKPKRQWKSSDMLYPAAMVAGLVAQVKQKASNPKLSFAAQLATPKVSPDVSMGSSPAMSLLRFQRLQKSRSTQDFYLGMIHAINLLGGTVNIGSMVDSVVHWHWEFSKGPDSVTEKRLAVRWANDYYLRLEAMAR